MTKSQNISFSDTLSQQRIAQARKILGAKVVNRIICFALYLLGVDRETIARGQKTPAGTVKSIIRAVFHGALPAFEDRRRSTSAFLPLQGKKTPKVTVCVQAEEIIVDLGDSRQIRIPDKNSLQAKVILLTMFNNGLLKSGEVAKILDITTAHVLNLARELDANDIPALIDKRQGQQQEYRFPPEVKSEVIQQFVVDIVVEGHTSGRLLSDRLQARCNLSLSERSIRHHVKELGLARIKRTLPPLLEAVKKTLKN
jgi:hypothetical protein